MRRKRISKQKRAEAKMKRILLIPTILILIIQGTVGAFAEISFSMPKIEDKDLSLTILFQAHNNGVEEPISGATMSLFRVADISCENGNAVYELLPEYSSLAKLSDGKDVTFNGLSASESLKLAHALTAKAKKHDRTAVTDKNGKCIFKNLEKGMYLVRESSVEGEAKKYAVIDPFLLSVPLGYQTIKGNYWEYNILSEPKTVVKRLPDTDSVDTNTNTNTDTDSVDTNTNTDTDSVDTNTNTDTDSVDTNTNTDTDSVDTNTNTDSEPSNTSSTSSNTSSTSSNTSSTSSNTSSTSSNTSSTSSNTSSTSSNTSSTSSNTSSMQSNTSSTSSISSNPTKDLGSNIESLPYSTPSKIENVETPPNDQDPNQGGGNTVVYTTQYDTGVGIPDKVKTGVVMGIFNLIIILCASFFTMLMTSKRREEDDTDNE